MAPPLKPPTAVQRKRKTENALQSIYSKYVTIEFLKYLMFNPASLPIVSVLILAAELILNLIVISRVPYTEIDWIAYMQECEGFVNGTTNYALLKGDTGPLVYPAAFVYIYTALYFITSHGQNVRLAQYIFAGIYQLQMWLVLRLYAKSRKVPPYVLVITAFTSYRIHSIYVLRLFNDPVAILFLYAALNLFIDRHWLWGSVCFSLGVGVKMNILLFAPALLLFYLTNLGWLQTLLQLAVCGLVQLLLAAPFLLTYPLQYLKGSFDLGRVFEHKWTVNYRFLSRSFFENKLFHLGLLLAHLSLLAIFAKPAFSYFKDYAREWQNKLQPQIQRKNEEVKIKTRKSVKKQPDQPEEEEQLTQEQQDFLAAFERGLKSSSGFNAPPPPAQKPAFIPTTPEALALLPFFLCNFIGIVFARSLHYQFYVWYFHSLPYLVWSTSYSLGMRFLILGLIELCWNTYPSTYFSSCTLHLCHFVLVFGVGRTMFKTMAQNATSLNVECQPLVKQETSNQKVNNLQNNNKAKVS